MREIIEPTELRAAVKSVRCSATSIGLVPTMGALHRGHLELVRQARAENDLVIMSIFVNPTQFAPDEDFDRYPRDIAHDRALAASASVDVLFVPTVETMYPRPQRVWIDPGPLARDLEGSHRPGHFVGVCTVVAKLFHLSQPDRAYFGQKDGQQAQIIEAMTHDLAFPIDIRIVPTVREPDGLALSSRNVYLSPEERREATALHRALGSAGRSIGEGERDPRTLEQLVTSEIEAHAPLGRIDYVALATLDTLMPCTGSLTGDAMMAVAVYFGRTRLIDNLMIRFTEGGVTLN